MLTAPAVADDTVKDVLSGGAGRDWFLAGTIDLVSGQATDEIKTGL